MADAPLEKIPLFVKAGTIIPMSAREAYVDSQTIPIESLWFSHL
ncbi:alpha-glucosidase 2 [Actinobacillus equuli]|nr:alpha-glucosidase 2 [Actinobacillus equuli]